jgi:hypothetical protein
MEKTNEFSFEISLSVLNHLGRNLYRSFITVLGEGISNSWDAEAKNVWIYVDKEENSFFIKDDGLGMTALDFQNKFLKIGYSKRKNNETHSEKKKRPYIGRKGIGKLALLSCARKITVISKTRNGDYIGGVIDNSALDKAITDDLSPQQYQLGKWSAGLFKKHTKNHKQGTIIYFEKTKDDIRNNLDFLKKTIALYFRFSLLDPSFSIYINNEKVTIDCLNDLMSKTEFLWVINGHKDPFIDKLIRKFTKEKNEKRNVKVNENITGFVASVETPRSLKIIGTEERAGIDLFVNGRLRERDILKHMSASRITESYLYGQIHYDELDDEIDRFTSSREGIVADDAKYKKFLSGIRKKLLEMIYEWDRWRIKHKQDGDSENPILEKKERKSLELFNVVSKEYSLPKKSKQSKKINEWVNALSDDARYNFTSYAECFVSENLVRKFIEEKKLKLSKEAKIESEQWKQKEKQNKGKGNLSISIRQKSHDLSYLSMDHLANMVDKKDPLKEACLGRDAMEYKPIRDALMHTALLTGVAKNKLSTVYTNIQARVIELLST